MQKLRKLPSHLLILIVVTALLVTPLYAGETYTVKSGDVLWKIARDHGLTIDELAASNQLQDINRLYPGQILKIDNTLTTTATDNYTFITDADSPLPSTLPTARYGITQKEVNIDFNGQNIVGTLSYPESQNDLPVVLMLHGFMSQRHELPILGTDDFFFDKTARLLAEQGYATLQIDFIGSGDSDGLWEDTTVSMQVANSEAALAYIKTLPQIDTDRIGILGFSQGGMVASITASRNPEIKSLILWSPVSNPHIVYANIFGNEMLNEGVNAQDSEKLMPYVTGWGENAQLKAKFFQDIYQLDPVAALTQYQGPVQVVVGKNDAIVTPQPSAGKIYLNYHPDNGTSEELVVFNEMDHTFNIFIEGSSEHNAALLQGLSFLERTLK